MKKLFELNLLMILLWLIIILISVNGVLASKMMPSPTIYYPDPYYSNNYDYSSSAQYYSVLFDGEGEANVVAKYVIFNNAREDVKEVRLEIPGQDVRILNVFSLGDSPKYNYNYGRVQFVDYKLDRLSNSVVLNVKMNNVIKPLQFTIFLVSYKSRSYSIKTNSLFGTVFDYNFETAKLDKDISYTHVGVSVDSNLFMEEVTSNVNYQSNMFETLSSSAKMTSASYERMQGYANNIGTGQKIKTANNLDPYESLTVSGKYSDTKIALNVWKYVRMFIFGLVGLFVLVFSFFRARRLIINSKDDVRKVCASGFLFALLLSVLWILFFVVMTFVERYYYNLWILFLVVLILLIISSVIILIGPCIYFAVKYKPVYMVWYLGSFFGSLLLFALIVVIGYFILFYKPRIYYEYY